MKEGLWEISDPSSFITIDRVSGREGEAGVPASGSWFDARGGGDVSPLYKKTPSDSKARTAPAMVETQ